MKAILEGLLFISGDDGLSIDKIKEILNLDDESTKMLIDDLSNDYETPNRGIRLKKTNDKIKLITKKEYKDYNKQLVDQDNNNLTDSALETLAIIAYNQPIVRTQIDAIRGVDSSYNIKKLLFKELIEEKGKSELPGRPILYGTTNRFLNHFGIKSLDELPILDEIDESTDEIDLFNNQEV